MHYDDDICMFILFVKVDANISVLHRVRQIELLDENTFLGKLHEYSSLFEFMAEEDPEYRMVQHLQNAGILPVNHGPQHDEPVIGQRPHGVSSTIPQSAIDEMMREPEFTPHQEVIQPRRSQHDPVMPVHEVVKQEDPLPEPIQEHIKREIILPAEPEADNADSLELIFRMPHSGERVRRKFLKTDTVSLLYDFIDDLQYKGKCEIDEDVSYTSHY